MEKVLGKEEVPTKFIRLPSLFPLVLTAIKVYVKTCHWAGRSEKSLFPLDCLHYCSHSAAHVSYFINRSHPTSQSTLRVLVSSKCSISS